MINIKKIILFGLSLMYTQHCLGQDLKTIDYHVHIFSEELLQNLADQGYTFPEEIFEIKCADGDCTQIDKIKAHNNGKLVLLSAPYAFSQDSSLEDSIILRNFVERENKLLSDLVYSDRSNLYGFCGINPKWEFALDETVRCINELGLDGIKFHFANNQIDISDVKTRTIISNILEYLSEKNAPVLIHLSGTDLTNGSGIAKQFIEFFLSNNNKQTIIFAHSGGQGGLYKFTLDILEEFNDFLKTDKYSANKKIYFELSGTILKRNYPGKIDSSELKKMISKIGSKHFLFGSDYPFRTGNQYTQILKKDLELDTEIFDEIKTRNIFEKR